MLDEQRSPEGTADSAPGQLWEAESRAFSVSCSRGHLLFKGTGRGSSRPSSCLSFVEGCPGGRNSGVSGLSVSGLSHRARGALGGLRPEKALRQRVAEPRLRHESAQGMVLPKGECVLQEPRPKEAGVTVPVSHCELATG